MLNILHVGHSSEPGGAELALLRLLAVADEWNATLVIPKGAGLGVFEKLAGRSPVIIKNMGPYQAAGAATHSKSPLALIGFVRRIVGQAVCLLFSKEFRNADVVHANTSRAAVYCGIASVIARKKFVVHLRDMVTVESLGRFGYLAFSKLALRNADGVISNSHSTLHTAKPFIARYAEVAVIPSPAGIEIGRNENVVASSVKTVGMLARIDRWKGQDLLIRAFAKVFQGGDTTLLLAGGALFDKGGYLDELTLLCEELEISSQVHFLGHVRDVRGYLDSLDICVQASVRPEPLGQNIIQYLARGKPVVASNEGGPTEWIDNGKNGLLFQARNSESLAEKLRLLKTDAGLRERLAEGAINTPGLLGDVDIARRHSVFYQALFESKPKEYDSVA